MKGFITPLGMSPDVLLWITENIVANNIFPDHPVYSKKEIRLEFSLVNSVPCCY